MPAPAEMALDGFEALAARLWQRIPEELKEGVEALVIEEKELGHPTLGGVYTLGECVTESWPSGYGDGGDVRSELVLYYGSFLALSFEDDAFEWEEEIWETITHSWASPVADSLIPRGLSRTTSRPCSTARPALCIAFANPWTAVVLRIP